MEDRLPNLKKASCYQDGTSYGTPVSRWMNLSKFDVEWAVFEIERMRNVTDNARDELARLRKENAELLAKLGER